MQARTVGTREGTRKQIKYGAVGGNRRAPAGPSDCVEVVSIRRVLLLAVFDVAAVLRRLRHAARRVVLRLHFHLAEHLLALRLLRQLLGQHRPPAEGRHAEDAVVLHLGAHLLGLGRRDRQMLREVDGLHRLLALGPLEALEVKRAALVVLVLVRVVLVLFVLIALAKDGADRLVLRRRRDGVRRGGLHRVRAHHVLLHLDLHRHLVVARRDLADLDAAQDIKPVKAFTKNVRENEYLVGSSVKYLTSWLLTWRKHSGS